MISIVDRRKFGGTKIKIPKFGGYMIAPSNVYFGWRTSVMSDSWNRSNDEGFYGYTDSRPSNSQYITFSELYGSGWVNSDRTVYFSGLSNRRTYGRYSDWRVPTDTEMTTILDGPRTGSTVNGISGCKRCFIRISDLTYADINPASGVLIFPDNYIISGSVINSNNSNSTFTLTNSQLEEYIDQGCAFLPDSGWFEVGSGWGNYGGFYILNRIIVDDEDEYEPIWHYYYSHNVNAKYYNITTNQILPYNTVTSKWMSVRLIR